MLPGARRHRVLLGNRHGRRAGKRRHGWGRVDAEDAVTGNHTYTALSGAEFFRCGLSGEIPLCWGQTLNDGPGSLYTDSPCRLR